MSYVTQSVPHRSTAGVSDDTPPTGDGSQIRVWQDDPANIPPIDRPVPDLAAHPAFSLIGTQLPAAGIYEPGTSGFRVWTAAEALRRGATFWQTIVEPICGPIKWQTGDTLPVEFDAGQDLNAYYDREALRFFHAETSFVTVYSGESPDIVCHELGHAVLDAIRPDLFDAASHEAAAFHESFGDMSALLCALELDEMAEAVIKETHGHLHRSSRLSRLAEQLGAAIRLSHPADVDPDCLRNAANSFTYQDPTGLDHSAPASVLSSEPHSFSRVFTGAFLEALAALLPKSKAGRRVTAGELRATAHKLATLLILAVESAPIVSNYFAEIAGAIVAVATPKDAAVLRTIFVRRSLLSLSSAATIRPRNHTRSAARGVPHGVTARAMTAAGTPALDETELTATHYGLTHPVEVQIPGQQRRHDLRASGADARSLNPVSAITAARSFTDDLVRRGRLDFGGRAASIFEFGERFTTHRLVADDGTVKLRRHRFDCGLCLD